MSYRPSFPRFPHRVVCLTILEFLRFFALPPPSPVTSLACRLSHEHRVLPATVATGCYQILLLIINSWHHPLSSIFGPTSITSVTSITSIINHIHLYIESYTPVHGCQSGTVRGLLDRKIKRSIYCYKRSQQEHKKNKTYMYV